jgi:hypothetical protein
VNPRRGHESLRDKLLRSKRSLDLYADLAGKPRMEIAMPPPPKQRAPAGANGEPLESDIQRAIIDGLTWHPMVALVERINSGVAVERSAEGKPRYIEFSRVEFARAADRRAMRSVDLSVMLIGGKRLVIEVKRPPWRKPRDDRERAQQAYIDHVVQFGGYGLFATSWDQVATYLKEIQRFEHIAALRQGE